MANDFTLEDVVFKTIHKNYKGVSIEEIATATGTGLNHLYRMANKEDVCNMPLSKAVPVMLSTNDYSILHFQAKATGHICIPMPRGIRKGTDPKMDVSQYSIEFNKLVQKLMAFIDDPSDERLADVQKRMRKHIGDSVNMKRRCEKHQLHQMELSL